MLKKTEAKYCKDQQTKKQAMRFCLQLWQGNDNTHEYQQYGYLTKMWTIPTYFAPPSLLEEGASLFPAARLS